VEVVQKSWDAWLRGDVDGAVAHYAPDAVWDLTHFRDWPERPYIGPHGMRRFMNEWLEVWDAFEVGIDDLFPLQDGRVVVLAWQRGKGRYSGLAMEMRWAQLITLRDGEIIHVDNYEDREEALEAVGLSGKAMPRANVEIARSVVASWERGDYSSTEWAHPDIEFVIADGPAPGRWTGLRGMAEGWRDVLSAWEEFHGEAAQDWRELDGERVLVLNQFGGRGKASGLDLGGVGVRAATLFHIRDGKVTRLVVYWDRDRALADLGLASEDRSTGS
jgi:ketosteroid isomerase-like protein